MKNDEAEALMNNPGTLSEERQGLDSGANWWAYVIALLLLIIGALAGVIVAGGV